MMIYPDDDEIREKKFLIPQPTSEELQLPLHVIWAAEKRERDYRTKNILAVIKRCYHAELELKRWKSGS